MPVCRTRELGEDIGRNRITFGSALVYIHPYRFCETRERLANCTQVGLTASRICRIFIETRHLGDGLQSTVGNSLQRRDTFGNSVYELFDLAVNLIKKLVQLKEVLTSDVPMGVLQLGLQVDCHRKPGLQQRDGRATYFVRNIDLRSDHLLFYSQVIDGPSVGKIGWSRREGS
jgi:hypothetical protein